MSKRFQPGWWIVPMLFLAIIIWLFAATFTLAQSTSGAASNSVSSNRNINASVSGAQGGSVNIAAPPAETRNKTTYGGTYRIESAPAVSPPAVFGGGHPCLAGKSGGLSVVGGGFSYGQGNPEPACMAYIMGNPEIALSIMFATDPKFQRAACKVGFFRVGNSRIPVKCKGDPEPLNVSSKAPSKGKALLSKCVKDGDRVRIAYTSAGKANKAAAKAQCLAHLGY